MAIPVEITNAWQRWSHRNDIVSDLALVEILARERIRNRMMLVIENPDIDILATDNPSIWLYAGLAEIHVLAQDSDELEKSLELFENAIGNYMLQNSIAQGLPTAVKTDYQS
jgi:hypothetical protein